MPRNHLERTVEFHFGDVRSPAASRQVSQRDVNLAQLWVSQKTEKQLKAHRPVARTEVGLDAADTRKVAWHAHLY